jgi:nitrate/nitrite-specific signal transduction histidine kinase
MQINSSNDKLIVDSTAIENLVLELQERAKELNCLYIIEENLNRSDITLRQAFHTVINAIPQGFQYPNLCRPKLVYGDIVYQIQDFEETKWVLTSDIIVQERILGKLSVFYLEEVSHSDHGPFLKGEKRLLDTIAERLGHLFFIKN